MNRLELERRKYFLKELLKSASRQASQPQHVEGLIAAVMAEITRQALAEHRPGLVAAAYDCLGRYGRGGAK